MTKKLLASVMAFALCQFMLATDMIVKQKNGEIKKFNVENVEEVIFNENSNIPNDSTVVDASESPLNFSIKPDSTVEVTGVNKDSEYIEIPSKVRVDGKVYTVNSIKYSAFSWKRSLTTLEIPSSITSIAESSVFSGSSKLKSINVASDNPNYSSVDGVLYNKDKTKIICVPGGIRGDFTIPSSVNCIGHSAFKNDSLTSIKIPSSVTKIENNAFDGCRLLTSIDIPSSVAEIGDGAFLHCYSLTNINVAADNANFTSVDGIIYNKEKTELVSYAYGIKKDTFAIPSTVTSVRGYAFCGCGIERIEVPSSVTSLGDAAFAECEVVIIDNLRKNVLTGDYTFEECGLIIFAKEPAFVVGNPDLSVVVDTSELKGVRFNVLSDSTAELSGARSDIDTIYIPSIIKINEKIYTVTTVGDYAFMYTGGKNLCYVKLPPTITKIGESAFNWLYINEIEIPSSVVEIGKEAFSFCEILKSVKISGNVRSIGEKAFWGCGKLDVVIDNSKDNIIVGEDAFNGCKSVTWKKE
ncbi:MAG: leucine-rich repeat domain-containing protein [Paludibacteraceae bacterium]|nr:leucine-rich repeat domain-containing protein [Paludibacteraceae bacterium]